MPHHPTLKEEILVAISLMPKHQATVQQLRKGLLDHFKQTTVTSAMNRLCQDGYLTKQTVKGKRNWEFLYTRTDKPFDYSGPGIVKAPDLPVPPTGTPKTGFIPNGKKKPEDPTQPDYWLARLDETISALQTLKEAIPVVLNSLLDLTRDLERLEKVKEILNGVKGAIRKNL